MPERNNAKVRIAGNSTRGYIVRVGEKVIYKTKNLSIAADVAFLAIAEQYDELERLYGVRLHGAGR